MQAIKTMYKGQTNTRGSCIVATCASGRVSIPFDSAHDVDWNMREACAALLKRMGWSYAYVGGSLGNVMVWVCERSGAARVTAEPHT